MKPYYRIKGKYPDGRNKIVIEKKHGKKRKVISKTLPKPEMLLDNWDTLKTFKIIKGKQDTQNLISKGGLSE